MSEKKRRNGVTPQLLLMENEKRATKKEIQKRNSWILKREGNKITAKDGSILYECQFCKGLNKSMFFNSQHDLDLHIQGLHHGYPIKKGDQPK